VRRFKTLLIALYNARGLGVRYLASALKQRGYPCDIIFFKSFSGHNMKKPTAGEYELLERLVAELNPDLIGVSYMCTFHREVMEEVTRRLKKTGKRVIWGGVCATLFPGECLRHVDLIVRGEAEETIVELVEALEAGRDITGIPNLAFRRDGRVVLNEVRPLVQDLDTLPFPDLGGEDKYYIEKDALTRKDPGADSLSYEIMASRGCPYRCSYCSNQSIKEIYAGKGRYVRLRSVESVIEELKAARRKVPGLRMVKFWDEIFPASRDWVEEFASQYRAQVNLPFEGWHHPLKVRPEVIRPLVAAGLSKVVVGIQSGSPYIRNKVFLRPESQERILECSRVLAEAGVPAVIYDLILDHPFETEAHLEETLDLCLRLARPFYLQLHGLSFLPGTEIERMALESGLVAPEEMQKLHSRPLEEQYRAMYWWVQGAGTNQSRVMAYWNTIIYLTQVDGMVPFVRWARRKPVFKHHPGLLRQVQKAVNFALIGKKGVRKLKLALGVRA